MSERDCKESERPACWMICEDESADFTVAHILEWMGDLSQERIVAKHAARQSLVRFDCPSLYTQLALADPRNSLSVLPVF